MIKKEKVVKGIKGLKTQDRDIEISERLDDIKVSYLECLKDIKSNGYIKEVQNGYAILNPSAKLLCNLLDRIRRLEQDVKKQKPDDELAEDSPWFGKFGRNELL
jgi:hypothetical protein